MFSKQLIDGRGVVGKPRHVDPATGQRIPFSPTLVSDRFWNADQTNTVDAVFSGNLAVDCAVTAKPYQGDIESISDTDPALYEVEENGQQVKKLIVGGTYVEIVGKNIDFGPGTPAPGQGLPAGSGELWVQANIVNKVAYLFKLPLADFVDIDPETNNRNFVTKRYPLRLPIIQGRNWDIRIEKVAGPTVGAFRVQSLRLKGELNFATEVVNNERGELVDLQGEPYPEGPVLVKTLIDEFDDGNHIHAEWVKFAPGKYVQSYSGVANMDPNSPDILQEA